jgi:hypothetical protein
VQKIVTPCVRWEAYEGPQSMTHAICVQRAYIGWSLKHVAQNYLFIATLEFSVQKVSRVTFFHTIETCGSKLHEV